MCVRILHTADWHIGRLLNKHNLLEDQNYFLNWLIRVLKNERIDVLMIAGDIYNNTSPSAEAVSLLDEFLTKVVLELKITTVMISGNHDSAEKLSFSSSMLESAGLIIAGGLKGLRQISFDSECGKVGITLLPYINPSMVKERFPNDQISSFDLAHKKVAEKYIYGKLNYDVNILCAHGTYMDFKEKSLEFCDSEISIGGSDIVYLDKFSEFDYIALGHLHCPQKAGIKGRYSGSPLKYSVSEASHKKQVVIVDIDKNKNLTQNFIMVEPLRDLRIIKCSFDEIMDLKTDDYVSVQLTDDKFIIDPHGRIRSVCPHILDLSYVNIKLDNPQTAEIVTKKSPKELFSDFYFNTMGCKMNLMEDQFLDNVMEEIESETD